MHRYCMYNLDFNNPLHVYFIGIGGISMSAIANILLEKGFKISGSDTKTSSFTQDLENKGAVINYGQRANNIEDGIDLVIYTAAIKKDNEEFAKAMTLNIPMLSRAEILGQIMANHKTAIAVSGTHGKTTTTSMLSEILLAGDTDPTILTGGVLNSIKGNLRIGQSSTMITEACEYTNSFLSFHPTLSIILNVKEDHMDFFEDITQIRESFKKFCDLLPTEGTLIINSEIDDISYFTKDLSCKVITYGIDDNISDYQAKNVAFDEFARGSYDLFINNEFVSSIKLNICGMHNVSNSLSSIAAARVLNLDFDSIKEGLRRYTGTNRRFEFKGSLKGINIIDDYAHHPDEIVATLNTAKNYPHNRIVCIFQPHTYTRTTAFLKEFASSLALADIIILTDIYAARETNTTGVSSKDILKELQLLGKEAYYFESFDDIENYLLENSMHNDLLITMGAGDVYIIGNHLLGL